MAAYGRSSLRDIFDGAPTPHIAHPPRTHHRDFYVATDGSFRRDGGGLGAVIETGDGRRVTRLALQDASPNNNVAEYKALERGLDALADRAPADVRVGVLVDHDQLASHVNTAVLATSPPSPTVPDVAVPPNGQPHWDGILERLESFTEVRAARIDSRTNPAHPLANDPAEYGHLTGTPDRCPRPDTGSDGTQIPPPSRADRTRGHSD